MKTMVKNNESMNPYIVPAAIVVAGLLVAGAVVYIGGVPSGGTLGGPSGDSGAVATPVSAAKAAGVKEGEFNKCLSEGRYADEVSADLQEAVDAGFGGTPTSVIVTPGGEQYFIEGALPADVLSQYIDAALADDDATLASLEAQFGVRGVDGNIVTSTDVSDVNEDDHIRGSMDATVKLIEYSDLECPFCKRFHPEVLSVMSKYGNNLAWVYRHLPLESIHPSARPLAEGSECVAELGGNDAFWAYIDNVFGS